MKINKNTENFIRLHKERAQSLDWCELAYELIQFEIWLKYDSELPHPISLIAKAIEIYEEEKQKRMNETFTYKEFMFRDFVDDFIED